MLKFWPPKMGWSARQMNTTDYIHPHVTQTDQNEKTKGGEIVYRSLRLKCFVFVDNALKKGQTAVSSSLWTMFLKKKTSFLTR